MEETGMRDMMREMMSSAQLRITPEGLSHCMRQLRKLMREAGTQGEMKTGIDPPLERGEGLLLA
jgi:hypothetical protein